MKEQILGLIDDLNPMIQTHEQEMERQREANNRRPLGPNEILRVVEHGTRRSSLRKVQDELYAALDEGPPALIRAMHEMDQGSASDVAGFDEVRDKIRGLI